MQPSQTRDIVVGLFVSAGLIVISYLSFSVGGARLSHSDEITVYAVFDEIGGLTARSPVVVAGVRVGRVESIQLDEDFRARVELRLQGDLGLPIDTSAAILTAGVLGNQYVGLVPGAEDDVLGPGDYLDMTESALILERLLGRVVQNLGAD